MKHSYKSALLVSAVALLGAPAAQAQQLWRPFRPGVIYSHALRNQAAETHTLRVDSAYRTAAGDSVYAFNRLMRQYVSPTVFRPSVAKSRNNLFGARLSWTPGQRFYTLESDAQPNVQTAASLRLYPQAAAGQTWVASTAPQLTAVVQSRSRQTILPGVQDSVATIELRSGTATTGTPLMTFVLSRSHGLLAGPAWLGGAVAGTAAAAPLLDAVPVPVLQSPYSPLSLFAMQPGDELGYLFEPFNYFSSIVCTRSYTLRRVLSRQQRADSLVITYQEQTRQHDYTGPNCPGPAATRVHPVRRGRLAFSLLTGRSPQFPALGLLSGEYGLDALFSNPQAFYVGLGLKPAPNAGCISSGIQLPYLRVYQNINTPPGFTFSPGLDAMGWYQFFGSVPGMGDVSTGTTALVYYRRSAGTPLVCGTFADFAGLLPTRAAQAAAVARLYPNPATGAATLTLMAPAAQNTRVVLRDALGRFVSQTEVRLGQTSVALALAGQPAGLYLVQVQRPGAVPVTLRLTKE